MHVRSLVKELTSHMPRGNKAHAVTREVHILQWRPRTIPSSHKKKNKKVHEWKNKWHKLHLLSPEIVPTLAPSSFQPCFLPLSDNTLPSGFKGLLTRPFTVYEALIQHLSMSPSSALQIWPPLRNFPRPNFISHIFILSPLPNSCNVHRLGHSVFQLTVHHLILISNAFLAISLVLSTSLFFLEGRGWETYFLSSLQFSASVSLQALSKNLLMD